MPILVMVLLLALGCAMDKENDQHTQQVHNHLIPEPSGKTLVYDCLVEWDIVLKADTGDAWLMLPDTTVHLPRVRSASGARFVSPEGDYMYWSKGDDAIIEINNKSYGYCDIDREEAVWQDARLRGAHFRAMGNEPGWYLEIFPDSIAYVLNYGDRVLSTGTPDPVVFPDKGITVYSPGDPDYDISIEIADKSCRVASGKELPSTVTLTIDGQLYRGCGRMLQHRQL
ncbi:MAG: MliC family protein [Balneolaceae bacterium]|nr:MliC family protein [Balneolaceae bacterium]